MTAIELHKGNFCISTDKTRLERETIHDFLRQSYWAQNIPREIVEKSIANSLCFGLYYGDKQIGFARVISDYATFAYLSDVFILESYRNQGLSKWLIEAIINHPDLQQLRRWLLATWDAQELYKQFGFRPLRHPEHFMEIHNPTIYE